MNNSIEDQIENEMNEISTDIDIIKTIMQNLYDGTCGFKDTYGNETVNFSILLYRQIRILSIKYSKINKKIYKYINILIKNKILKY